MLLEDAQVGRAQCDLLVLWPDQQDARRLGPRHAVAHRDEIIMRFQRDDLCFHLE
jgi:hypothetical protein